MVEGYNMTQIRVWWQACRPFSLTVSILPPMLGAITAKIENPGMALNWLFFVLTFIGCVFSHAAANMLSDYFDFNKRVDRNGTYGSSGVLTGRLMPPRQLLIGAIVTYVIAAVIAVYFIIVIPHREVLVGLIALGALLGIFYTANPFSFKYNALGDLAIFISFGPAMTLGAYFVQTQHFSWVPVLYAIPVGFLVDAVLHGNNMRDVMNDKVVNIKTLAMVLGDKNARGMYYGLIFGAYIAIVALIAFDGVPVISLITFLSLPLAFKLAKTVKHRITVPEKDFVMIDAATAQLHSAFGFLFLVSLLLQHFLIR